ncbi:DNA-3-methyladenine glycosylase I [Eubacterium aggregans]|uniref:DNA-3-methyladenine glycosylase I n=1 Tax=Eubacterium aggregans TaxID=81409 RepID=UPI0023F10614|nr:DNA-3-methyladenine glycosylase I [Eubacterium aggregans]MDD4691192.1 DNA-3-methyladenine glycosylase I [Eubacterium aggregans]
MERDLENKGKGPIPAVLQRCTWVDLKSPEYINYHDYQWGVPVHDDRLLFEMLILEGFQAGLSWLTILKKRPNFQRAFDNFDPAVVSAYDTVKKEALMQDAGIVRNRRKIEAAIKNAQVFLDIQEEYGSFDTYLWGFTQGQTLVNTDDALPAKTPLSDTISADLKGRGMGFVGSTIIYAFLQAVGVVNDHALGCFCHPKQQD